MEVHSASRVSEAVRRDDDGAGSDAGSGADGSAGEVEHLRRKLATALHYAELVREQRDSSEGKLLAAQQQLHEQATGHRQQVERLVRNVEHLMDRNMSLQIELSAASEQNKALQKRADQLDANADVLRRLLSDGVQRHAEPVSPAEERFWGELATAEVLALSRPPKDFPVPPADAAVRPALKDLAVMQARIAAVASENRALRETLDRERQAADASRATWQRSLNRSRSQERRYRVSLAGAVRRIQWLIAEVKQLREKLRQRSDQLGRVEVQLLRLAESRRATSATQRGRSGVRVAAEPGRPASGAPLRSAGGGVAETHRNDLRGGVKQMWSRLREAELHDSSGASSLGAHSVSQADYEAENSHAAANGSTAHNRPAPRAPLQSAPAGGRSRESTSRAAPQVDARRLFPSSGAAMRGAAPERRGARRGATPRDDSFDDHSAGVSGSALADGYSSDASGTSGAEAEGDDSSAGQAAPLFEGVFSRGVAEHGLADDDLDAMEAEIARMEVELAKRDRVDRRAQDHSPPSAAATAGRRRS